MGLVFGGKREELGRRIEGLKKKRRGQVDVEDEGRGEREREMDQKRRVWYLKLMLDGGERMEGMFGGEWGRKREKAGRMIWCDGCMINWTCVI